MTKSIGGQSLAVKPLPGEMTPLWDKAAATVLADGTTAWVDVPIEAKVVYTAVRNGFHAHEAGESCGRDHSPVQAVQKLTVHTDADGMQRSLIATIVPEADCTAELNGFSSAEGLDGFSGFVSWHDLTGKLIRVAKYENGVRTRSAEPTGDNEKENLDIVDGAILYSSENQAAVLSPMITKADWSDRCNFCHKYNCKAPNDAWNHCNVCGQYDPDEFGKESQCICRPRCPWCHTKIPVGKTECPNGCDGFPIKPPVFCTVCGAIDCPGHELDQPPTRTPPVIVQRDILAGALGTWITHEQLQRMLDGSYGIDQEFQNAGDEYMHGLYVPGYNNEQETAFDNMKSYFIRNVRGYLFLTSEAETAESFYYLGMALHPIADHYIENQTRVDMLNFYAYNAPQNILVGQYIVPYTSDMEPGTKAVRHIFNAVQNLDSSASEDEIVAIFDGWLKQIGGGY